MKKFGKFGIVAAAASLIAALSVSVAAPVVNAGSEEVVIPKGFEAQDVEITGANEALKNWQYYFKDDKDADGKARGWAYESENLHVLATKDGRTGNALHMKRDKADGELVMYSYAFDVAPDQTYIVGAFVKLICPETSGNKIYFNIKEHADNGSVVGDENVAYGAVEGKRDNWTETTFSYKTSNSAKTLILRIRAEGIGDFYVDDITVRPSSAAINTVKFGLQSFSANECDANAARLTSAQISSESSDNDGASLRMDANKHYGTYFGMLPHGQNYTFSFKYKTANSGRFALRLDCVTLEGKRLWFVEDLYFKPTDGWKTLTYEFTAVTGKTDIQWMDISVVDCVEDAVVLIDEMKITGTDEDGKTMQYLANGSFSGAYTEGYFYEHNANIAKQEDGSSVFIIGNASKDATTGQPGYLDISTANLETGKTYTLKFDYRAGNFDPAVRVLYGTHYTDDVMIGSAAPHNVNSWTSMSVPFEAKAAVTAKDGETRQARLEIYGATGGWPTYYRNFSIVDEDNNEYITNQDLVAPEVVLGENVFPYGTFDGNVNYVAKDWTFNGNGNIYGLVFDKRWEPDAKPDWKICLYGTEEAPASAISKEITVSKRTLAVNCKTYTIPVTLNFPLS